MEHPDSSISSSARAARLFGEFLRENAGPKRVELDEFCERHPDDAPALRRLCERWSRADAPGAASSLGPTDADSGGTTRPVAASGASGVFERLVAKGPADQRYRMQGEIARGGMGVIQGVWDRELRRSIAMKVMLADEAAGSTAESTWDRRLARFLEEAQVTGQLEHPGVVPVHELGLDAQGRAFFTMQRVRGRDLKEIFELVQESRDGWGRTRALGVILKVCEAMAFAHDKGVVHRDLKPANVMVGRFGETYVMDWGLAKVLGDEDARELGRDIDDSDKARSGPASIVRTDRKELTDSDGSPVVTLDGDILGTPCFMSPEQAKGRLEDIGPRVDVYSVGCMLYNLLTGCMPYVPAREKASPSVVLQRLIQGPPTPVAQLGRDVPSELVAICEKAMARELAERYESMLEMAEDLRAFLENRVVSAYRTGAVQEFRKWIARNRATATTAAAALVVTFAGLGVAAWTQTRANRDLASLNTEIGRARDEAVENERRAERLSYAANLAASHASLTLHNAEEARRRLEACAPKLRGWEWHRSHLLADSSLRAIEVGGGALWGIAFRPDGERFAVAGEDGIVREFDTDSGAPLGEFVGHEKLTQCVAYNFDGTRLASGSMDRTVRVWDTATHSSIWVLSAHKGHVRSVAWSPDGKHLVSAGRDREARLWDAASGTEIAALEGHTSSVNSCRFSRDGTSVITSSVDRTVRTWSAQTGEELLVFEGSEIAIADADASPSRHWLAGAPNLEATGLQEEDKLANAVLLWRNAALAQPRLLIGHRLGVTAVAFSPSGDQLASTSNDRSLRIWDPASRKSRVLLGHSQEVTGLAWEPSGARLATSSRDGTVRVWPANGIASDVLRGHSQAIKGVALAADGRHLYSVAQDPTLRVWNLESGLVELIRSPLGAPLAALAVSPDASWIAITGTTGQIARWGIDDFNTQEVAAHKGVVRAVAVDPAGAWIVAGADDGEISRWSAQLEPLGRFVGHESIVQSLAVAPGGQWFASGARDHTVRVWDVLSGECSQVFDGTSRVSAVAISRDGTLLAGARTDGRVDLWSTSDWQKLAEFKCPETFANCIVFTTDGARLVGGLKSGSVAFWDTQSRELLVALREDSSSTAVSALALGPDGRDLVFGTAGGEIVHWSGAEAAARFDKRESALAIRSAALPLVDGLFEQFGTPETVQAMLELDDRLQGPLLEAAEMLVGLVGGKPDQLYHAVRATLLAAGSGEDEYTRALWNARWSLEQEPDGEKSLMLLGMAHYRLGRYEEAIQALERSDSRRRATRGRPEVAGFLALAHWNAGHAERAEAYRAEFVELMQVPIVFSNQAYVDLYREVEALLGPVPGG